MLMKMIINNFFNSWRLECCLHHHGLVMAYLRIGHQCNGDRFRCERRSETAWPATTQSVAYIITPDNANRRRCPHHVDNTARRRVPPVTGVSHEAQHAHGAMRRGAQRQQHRKQARGGPAEITVASRTVSSGWRQPHESGQSGERAGGREGWACSIREVDFHSEATAMRRKRRP